MTVDTQFDECLGGLVGGYDSREGRIATSVYRISKILE